MGKREFKDKIYGELARITKALANPHRLEMIELLAQGDFSVEQIAEHTNLPMANASQHLQVLKKAQLVDVSRQGNFIHYRLANGNVFKAWKALRDLGVDRMGTIDKLVRDFRQSTFKSEAITLEMLIGKLESGKITLLDVRPRSEFHNGHIAKAISIPLTELKERMIELPKRRAIVAYCRGPFCLYADEAVAMLKRAGFKATRLEEGFPDWKIKGLPIEVSLN